MHKNTFKMSSLFYFGLVLFAFGASANLECEYYNATECEGKGEDCQQSRKTVTCDEDGPSKVHACFVVWKRSPNGDNSTGFAEAIQLKGCFLNNKDCIGQENCIENTEGKKNKHNVALFCCCSKDFCNRDYTWSPEPTKSPSTPAKAVLTPPPQNTSSIYIFILVPLGCALFLTGAFLINRRIFKKPGDLSTSLGNSDEENILLAKSESQNDGLPITLLEVKASGRFGNVWRASLLGNADPVAVKILPLRERASWKLEQEIYSLPLMCDSQFILKFIGNRNYSEGDSLQLWLISEYLEFGSLYDYLKGNILKWSDLIKISTTMCEGLAFLHDEIDGGAKGYKPAVAHRDFKSKNVLLRPDLTACVADFGLAHIFYPNKPVGTCHGQVGTRRYMAPEVLEGAVSFTRDNFQRIDMYACGLVLWELASRCSAQQGPVGEYKLPFEEFVGQQPTLEEMKEAVVTQRKRPTIRSDWCNHTGLTLLSEAMKDAWDQDSEARISASCIVERLNSLNTIK